MYMLLYRSMYMYNPSYHLCKHNFIQVEICRYVQYMYCPTLYVHVHVYMQTYVSILTVFQCFDKNVYVNPIGGAEVRHLIALLSNIYSLRMCVCVCVCVCC